MKNFFLILVIVFICSCKSSTSEIEYSDGKQVMNINDRSRSGEKLELIELQILKPESVRLKQQAVFKVFLTNPEYKLVKGLFDCSISESSLIDTLSYKVNNCNKEFVIQNDTLLIAFKPQVSGKQTFEHEIIGISKDIDGIFRYHKKTFEYEVQK